jgi:PIN domain nuclease of toxin-antitoxin system
MRVLLDTQVFFWWETDNRRLSNEAREAIADATHVFVSAVTAWELATKTRLGKWPEAAELAAEIEGALEAEDFEPLPISIEHARTAGFLATAHRDPFDRMLAAQAQVESLALVTADPIFNQLGIQVIW